MLACVRTCICVHVCVLHVCLGGKGGGGGGGIETSILLESEIMLKLRRLCAKWLSSERKVFR